MPTGTNDWDVETYRNKFEKSRIQNLGNPVTYMIYLLRSDGTLTLEM